MLRGPAYQPWQSLIAVGSGTINDLCKYAAHLDRKPYAVFGTAPSMNGYTSANAAITVNGLKKSLAATMPAGVFLDLAVLAAAPPRMIRSGLGDSLCRPTAQADWLLSHRLTATDLSWCAGERPAAGPLAAKARYRQADAACTLEPQSSPDAIALRFPDAQWAVTPGQSAVLYDGEVCLGGGVIDSAAAGG